MIPRVLGIDPSLTATAVASSDGWVKVTGTRGHRGDSYPQRLDRLHAILSSVEDLLGGWRALDLAVMEGPAYSRADPSAWDRAWLWWEIYRWLAPAGRVVVVTPNQAKQYATGKGNATKGAVVDAVARRWPQYATRGDDNAADAVVLLAIGMDRAGCPLAPVPAAHRKVLDRISWPDGLAVHVPETEPSP